MKVYNIIKKYQMYQFFLKKVLIQFLGLCNTVDTKDKCLSSMGI